MRDYDPKYNYKSLYNPCVNHKASLVSWHQEGYGRYRYPVYDNSIDPTFVNPNYYQPYERYPYYHYPGDDGFDRMVMEPF